MSNTLAPEIRQAVVQEVIQLAREKYVYPDVGQAIAQHIQRKLERGTYDDIVDADDLALALTVDLREVSKDQHWLVLYNDQQAATAFTEPESQAYQEEQARWAEQLRQANFGFERVERLKGNVGYMDLRGFAPPEYAGETAVAAMQFLAHCDALIIDLRQNHGGEAEMVQLLLSYLVKDEPQHINSFYYRPTDDYQQFWTLPFVPGRRLSNALVYVLISQATGSAAEEFSYNLKHMQRATLVGETTLGAAHPVELEIVQEHFQVQLPFGRAINPITKGNWEGEGVKPHIVVRPEKALETAHLHALEQLAEKCAGGQQKRLLEWDLEIARSLYAPVAVQPANLARYAGQYGQRTFALQGGVLIYTHQQSIVWKLAPIGETRFHLDEELKFEFTLDDQGVASAVVISYRDGRPEISAARTTDG